MRTSSHWQGFAMDQSALREYAHSFFSDVAKFLEADFAPVSPSHHSQAPLRPRKPSQTPSVVPGDEALSVTHVACFLYALLLGISFHVKHIPPTSPLPSLFSLTTPSSLSSSPSPLPPPPPLPCQYLQHMVPLAFSSYRLDDGIYLQHVVPLAFSSCRLDDGIIVGPAATDTDAADAEGGGRRQLAAALAAGEISSDSEDEDEEGALRGLRGISVRTAVLDEKAAAAQAIGAYAQYTKAAFGPNRKQRMLYPHTPPSPHPLLPTTGATVAPSTPPPPPPSPLPALRPPPSALRPASAAHHLPPTKHAQHAACHSSFALYVSLLSSAQVALPWRYPSQQRLPFLPPTLSPHTRPGDSSAACLPIRPGPGTPHALPQQRLAAAANAAVPCSLSVLRQPA
ncbi:unnamed protein product [Closterium sp. NIES-54]